MRFDASFFFYLTKGCLEKCFARFDFAFGEVPAAVSLYEEHGTVGGSDDATGGPDPSHAALEEA